MVQKNITFEKNIKGFKFKEVCDVMRKSNIKKNIVLFSNANGEPTWMKEYRLNSHEKIDNFNHPSFGPEIKLDVDLNSYLENKSIPFHVAEEGFIVCDIQTAFNNYPNLIEEYFNKLIESDENRYTILTSSIFESGYFIYIPKNSVLSFPIINKNTSCHFTRNLIIVDEGAELNIIDYGHSSSKFKCDCTEIFVNKEGKCRYLNLNINNFNSEVTSIKRAKVEEMASMDWINIIMGSNIYMGYPTTILKGNNSSSSNTTLVKAEKSINIGAKMIHVGTNTSSNIKCYGYVDKNGELEIRNTVNISERSTSSDSKVLCEYSSMSSNSKYDNVPKFVVSNDSSHVSFKNKNGKNINMDIIDFVENNFLKLSNENKQIIQNLIDCND